MFPRADIAGARPVTAIEATKTIVAVADARQDVLQRLTQIAVGRMMQAQVLSHMTDGTFMVKVADTAVRMNLPSSAQVGDTVELTLVAAQPRPTFSLALPAEKSDVDTSLSSAARLIDKALRTAQKEGAPTAVVGKVPVLPSAAATPTQIATALKDTLTHSGLFYESHVEQWASGERPLADLMREPQAKNSNESLVAAALLRARPQSGAGETPTANSTINLKAADVITPPTATVHEAVDGDFAPPPPLPSFLPADPPAQGESSAQAVPVNASANDATQANNLQNSPPVPTTSDDASSAGTLVTHNPSTDPSIAKADSNSIATDSPLQLRAETMNNDSARMISLQLDTLEQRRVAWQGELWPGQQMEWEVSEDASNSTASEVERSWQSVVRFELPNLGSISASIRLTGQRLQVQVRAANEDTATLLRTHGSDLASALDAAGSPLDFFTVKRDESV
jgi:hypothetical protein